MPLKRKPTPIFNSNILAIRPQNAVGYSVDKAIKITLAKSKLLSKF